MIKAGLEDFDFLPGDNRPPHPPNQFFSLATEHAAANNLNPTRPTRMVFHGPAPSQRLTARKIKAAKHELDCLFAWLDQPSGLIVELIAFGAQRLLEVAKNLAPDALDRQNAAVIVLLAQSVQHI